jgi:hypothetical protein
MFYASGGVFNSCYFPVGVSVLAVTISCCVGMKRVVLPLYHAQYSVSANNCKLKLLVPEFYI